jgi:alpha-tubulin suppressor-like RCC1 family protein
MFSFVFVDKLKFVHCFGSVYSKLNDILLNNYKIKTIFATSDYFVGLTVDGDVIQWGQNKNVNKISNLKNVTNIVTNNDAFACLTINGSVHVFGNEFHGGSIPEKNIPLRNFLASKIVAIASTSAAFCALNSEGVLCMHGEISNAGGELITSTKKVEKYITDVKQIFSNKVSFAVLRINIFK